MRGTLTDLELQTPPRPLNFEGRSRQIGVEIEFAAVAARDGAAIVQRLFGGDVREEDPHRYHVEGGEFGSFVCELDSQYAHAAKGAEPTDERESEILRSIRSLWGDFSSAVVPCEVVCPPIPYEDLHRLDELVAALTESGAEGTGASPLYAFGAQLNPDIATDDAAYLTAMLKAYLLASDWLRATMSVDLTRRLTAFAQPFPTGYAEKLLRPDYWPDRTTLIQDYLAFNPTRNRELDMLPLWKWLDEDTLAGVVDDPRVKARPTFHYRLPDAKLSAPHWSISLEWRRWLVVERLAEHRDLLDEMAETWSRKRSGGEAEWPIAFSQAMMLARA